MIERMEMKKYRRNEGKNMKHKLGVLVLIVVFMIGIFGKGMLVSAETKIEEPITEPANLYSISACLMDAETGRVLFEKNGHEKRAMASTTKIMTLIVTLEHGDLNSVVTISSNAARQPDVQLNVNAGEQYYLKDLLYSLMLESHNDTAVAIAEHVGGSVEGFAGLMNQKAEELGLSNTYFITPNGLDKEDENGKHSTTAVELARIMSYCIMESPKKEVFLEITRTPNYTFSDLEGERSFSCYNHNAFLNMMNGALSGKTGFTADAGYCYVGALEQDGKTFVVTLLGCGWPNNKTYKWSDTKKLMNYGIDNFEKVELFDTERVFEAAEVINGQETTVELGLNLAEEAKTLPFMLRKDEIYQIEYKIPETLTAPVIKNSKVGEVNYYIGEELIMQYPIYAVEEVKMIDYAWCIKSLLKKYLFL